MPASVFHHALNVGVVDAENLHRVDLERMRLAAEDQTNILCMGTGKGFFRPGTQHLSETANGDKCRLIEFDAGDLQVYALELTDSLMRVRNGEDLVTRPSVSTAITSGNFDASTGWTLGTDAGTTCSISGGALRLQAFGRGARAFARQQVTVAGADQNKVHALRITVFRGPVAFRIGSTSGGQEYMRETLLRTGYHSLAFIPTGNFYIEFSSTTLYSVYVNDVNVEAAGVMTLPTIWEEDDLPYIRYDQSLDVLFVACEGRKQQRIESRGDSSWSVVDYDSDDGPFLVARSADVKLKPTVLEGSGLLQSDIPFFSEDHVGSLIRIYHNGQKVSTYLAGENQFTPPIMVTGNNEPDYNERFFNYTVAGTWAGTLRWQRSLDGEDVEFHRFRREQASSTVDITANLGPITNDDNDDNAIAYYRLGFEAGSYTSGAAQITIDYRGGGGYGIARIVSYNSTTEVAIDVLKPFMDTSFTDEWREGAWSEVNGWPLSVAFDDGRLTWGGYDAFWGSISDAFESFDEDFVGDAGPLLRSIAVGGARNEARWLLPLSQLLIGTSRLIASARASSLDETKTPSNFGIRRQGTNVGAARINPALLADDRALFVEEQGFALYEINYDGTRGKYVTTEFSKLTKALYSTGITGVAVQNRPDQRIWVTLASGDAVCIVFEPAQQVVAAIPISTSSDTDMIESICVLPGGGEGQERVLMSIKRVVDGVTSRRIELLALDEEAAPADITKCLDAHIVIGAGSATVTGLDHLVGRTVRAWVDGDSVDDADGNAIDFVVDANGEIELPTAPTIGGCVGLPYRGRYKSAKIEYGAPGATSMLKNKTITGLGLLLADYCRSGVKIGTEFDNPLHPLRSLRMMRAGKPVTSDVVNGPDVIEPVNPVDGKVGFDTRACIELNSPKPASILALVVDYEGYGG